MRTIEFRGLRTDGNGWAYGQYASRKDSSEHYIIQDLSHIDGWEWNCDAEYVDPSTVGQFTGLYDKNGVKVFEGSRMKISLPMGGFWGNVKTDKVGVVVYEPEKAGFLIMWDGDSRRQNYERLDCDLALTGEVTGNIHEPY